MRQLASSRRAVAALLGLTAVFGVCAAEYVLHPSGGLQHALDTWAYDDLVKRDKLSLDLFWVKDKSLTDTDSLPPPDVLATEIADDWRRRSRSSPRSLRDCREFLIPNS